MSRAGARAALVAALAAPPLLLLVLPLGLLPSGLAYLGKQAPAALFFPAALGLLVYGLAPRLQPTCEPLTERLARVSPSRLSIVLGCAGFVASVLLMPASRRNATAFGGDEPKYLRMAESLLHDLDVDVASQSHQEWTVGRQFQSLRRLLRDVGEEIPRLFRPQPLAEGHRWNLGNWTLEGIHGGQYYVQSPGLPLLLLPSLILREILAPERTPAFLPLLTLAALWSMALAQTARLASEVSSSTQTGLVAGVLTACSAPLLMGGFHFYPESAAVALIPWALRYARAAGPMPSPVLAAALGLGCGFLPWLHAKYLLTALALLALLAWRLRKRRLALTLLVCGAGLEFAALALFDHHVTGLLLPDAFYRRYGTWFYSGVGTFASPMIVNGLVTALFGARDGLLVMAPILIAGTLAAGVAWKHDRRSALELAVVFSSLWIAAAVHGGGAPGPPGRLMGPVACALAGFLALGLARSSRDTAYLLTTATLATLTLAITAGMLVDWRRTVNPYREMFPTQQTDFAKDLPDGPARPDGAPFEAHKSRDRWRGALLVGLLASCAWRFARQIDESARPLEWRLARWSLGLWSTIAAAAVGLSALGP